MWTTCFQYIDIYTSVYMYNGCPCMLRGMSVRKVGDRVTGDKQPGKLNVCHTGRRLKMYIGICTLSTRSHSGSQGVVVAALSPWTQSRG